MRAYSDNFRKYNFNNLNDLFPGKNKYLEHLCNCIINHENTVVENW